MYDTMYEGVSHRRIVNGDSNTNFYLFAMNVFSPVLYVDFRDGATFRGTEIYL